MKLIAEISCNHGGCFETALDLIKQVAPYATHIKFQLWEPDTMAVPGEVVDWQGNLRELRLLYREAQTPATWLPELLRATIEAGAIAMVSVFDRPSLGLLEGMGCPEYKIASFEAVDLDLVTAVAETGKPITISTGQLEQHEIHEVAWAVKQVNDDITLLHCVSQYPTPPENINMARMTWLRQVLPFCKVGYSDHSVGLNAAALAISLGAAAIERHVYLGDHTLDAGFSSTPGQFAQLADMAREIPAMQGDANHSINPHLRRSLYFARDMEEGETVTEKDLITRRPNRGLSPLKIKKCLGRKLTEAVVRYQPVQLSLFK